MDEDDIVVSKKVLNDSLIHLLLGIRVRYMIDGVKDTLGEWLTVCM